MDHSRVAVAVLLSPQGRAAATAGNTGTLVRLLRKAAGWNQHELARRSGYSQSTISHGVQEVSGSGRIIARLRRTVDLLGTQQYRPATTFALAAGRLLPTAL